MDREIKFRGKRIDNGEWAYGDYERIHTAHGNGIAIRKNPGHVNDGYIDLIPDEVDPSTVGQYTGLHDKNGKEIYEGDIMRSSNGCTSVVKIGEFMPTVLETFFKDFGMLGKITGTYLDCISPNICHGDDYFISNGNIAEVVGNVYDSPELNSQKQKVEE